MKKELASTHQGFAIKPGFWFDVIAACKEHFGYNNYLQQYHLRPWITSSYTLYIRNDLLDDKFITYLGLVCKSPNEQ